jgi:hypothetical protein
LKKITILIIREIIEEIVQRSPKMENQIQIDSKRKEIQIEERDEDNNLKFD